MLATRTLVLAALAGGSLCLLVTATVEESFSASRAKQQQRETAFNAFALSCTNAVEASLVESLRRQTPPDRRASLLVGDWPAEAARQNLILKATQVKAAFGVSVEAPPSGPVVSALADYCTGTTRSLKARLASGF